MTQTKVETSTAGDLLQKMTQTKVETSIAGEQCQTKPDAASDAQSAAVATKPDAASDAQSEALVASILSCMVWPFICALPLALTVDFGPNGYKAIFPASWYDEAPVQHPVGPYGVADPRSVKPLGLILGISAVAVGQCFLLAYHWLRQNQMLGATLRVQPKKVVYDFVQSLSKHLSNPEGFVLMGAYLSGTWMFGLMPASYYAFEGGINWVHVVAQLLVTDFIQYCMHFGEHKVSSWIYRKSHKPHHRFTNPQLFNAYDGTRVVPANVWSYMAFGSLYANWLMLIHSETSHSWDWIFRKIGFGTAADHHVHHHFFVFNYGHTFMYWDKLFGTYRNPASYAGAHFSKAF